MPRPRALQGRENEVIEMWNQGRNVADMAQELGVAHSTILLELDRLGLREQPTRLVIQRAFERQRENPEFFEVLGFIWGIGSKVGDKFMIRHQDQETVARVAASIPYSSFFHLQTKERDQWVCQFGLGHPMYMYMEKLGWKGRNDEDRPFPVGEIDELAFVKGFVKAHYTYDTFKNKGRIVPRIRIYSGKHMLDGVNRVLNEQLGTTVKKIQKHGKSDVCHILYYTSKNEVPKILELLKNN